MQSALGYFELLPGGDEVGACESVGLLNRIPPLRLAHVGPFCPAVVSLLNVAQS